MGWLGRRVLHMRRDCVRDPRGLISMDISTALQLGYPRCKKCWRL